MERVAETPGANIRDGRRRKGERRRRLLLDATMRVIENGGVAAVSQRVVAQEAQVPPSTVTYYFPTIDELLVAALTACNDRYIVQLDRLADDDGAVLDELARMIAESGTKGRVHVVAEYELFLLAARRADMRAELRRWHDALDRLMARFLEGPVERAGVTAAIDGLFLRYLGADTPPSVAEVRQILSRLVSRLRA